MAENSLPEMYTIHDSLLKIELEAPKTWHTESNDRFSLFIAAPQEDGFKANLGLNLSQTDKPQIDSVKATLEAAIKNEEATFKDYKPGRFDSDEISSSPGFVRTSDWFDTTSNLLLSSIQVAVLLIPDVLPLVMNMSGTCLQKDKAKTLPILEYMIKSVRFI